jgi:hypothetical protein
MYREYMEWYHISFPKIQFDMNTWIYIIIYIYETSFVQGIFKSYHKDISHIFQPPTETNSTVARRLNRRAPMTEPWSPATSRFAATASDGASTHHEASGGRGGWDHTKTVGKPWENHGKTSIKQIWTKSIFHSQLVIWVCGIAERA